MKHPEKRKLTLTQVDFYIKYRCTTFALNDVLNRKAHFVIVTYAIWLLKLATYQTQKSLFAVLPKGLPFKMAWLLPLCADTAKWQRF